MFDYDYRNHYADCRGITTSSSRANSGRCLKKWRLFTWLPLTKAFGLCARKRIYKITYRICINRDTALSFALLLWLILSCLLIWGKKNESMKFCFVQMRYKRQLRTIQEYTHAKKTKNIIVISHNRKYYTFKTFDYFRPAWGILMTKQKTSVGINFRRFEFPATVTDDELKLLFVSCWMNRK